MADVSVQPEPFEGGIEPPSAAAGRWRQRAVTAIFLAPAAIFLLVWIVYPTINTIIRSFFDREGSTFVWFDNYKTLFTSDTLVTAIKNNAIWLAVVPALVTAIGLIFAVLTERIRWSVAFKIAVFMPMAISLFAAGVIWHIMFVRDPNLGAVNAGLKAAHDTFSSQGPLTNANASSPQLKGTPKSGFFLVKPLQPGQTARLGL